MLPIFQKPLRDIGEADILELQEREEIESLFAEFKREPPSSRDIAKSVASFANTHGGYLLIGVEADKATNTVTGVPGVDMHAGMLEQVTNSVVGNVQPFPGLAVRAVKLSVPDKCVVMTEIEEGVDPPYIMSSTGVIYVRTPQSSDPIDRVRDRYSLERLYEKGERAREDLNDKAQARLRLVDELGPREIEGVGSPAWSVCAMLIPFSGSEAFADGFWTGQTQNRVWEWARECGLRDNITQTQDCIYSGDWASEGVACCLDGATLFWLWPDSSWGDTIPGFTAGMAPDVWLRLRGLLGAAKKWHGEARYVGRVRLYVRVDCRKEVGLLWRPGLPALDIHRTVRRQPGKISIQTEVLSHDLGTDHRVATLLVDVSKELLRAFGQAVWDQA